MAVKNFLSEEEIKNLQLALQKDERPEVRTRALMFLLQNDGKTYEQRADFIGCSRGTVASWVSNGCPEDLSSLEDKRKKGNHQKATESCINLLLDVIDKEPTDLGYEFGRWTGARLSIHLEKETGIKLSKSQIVRILKKRNMFICGENIA